MPEKRPCRFCGLPILFVRNTETGATIPLTPVATFYVLDGEDAVPLREVPAGERGVSHWETCSKRKEAERARDRAKARRSEGPRGGRSRGPVRA